MIFCFVFGEKSKQVVQTWPRNNPRKTFFWTRKENWKLSDIFPEFRPKYSSRVSKNAIQMSRGASLGITFFAEMFCFQLFTYLGRKNLPFLVVFSSSFPISRLTRSEKTFELNPFLKKKFLYLFWKFWEKWTNYFFCLFVDNSLPWVQTAIFRSKRKLRERKSFETKIQYCQKNQNAPQHILWSCQNRIQHYQRNNLRKKINLENFFVTKLSPAVKGEVIYFWPKIGAGCPNMTE